MNAPKHDRTLDRDFGRWLFPKDPDVVDSIPATDDVAPLDSNTPVSTALLREPIPQGEQVRTLVPTPDPARQWFVRDAPVLDVGARSDVQFFVNGKDYCADLHNQLRSARSHVYMTGLHFMHDFGLTRSHTGEHQLGKVLRDVAERGDVKIYLLVNLFWPAEMKMIGAWWNKQYVYFNEPHRNRSRSKTSLALVRRWLGSVARDGSKSFRSVKELAVSSVIASNGHIERYFPATHTLFRLLDAPNIKCRLDVHPGHVMHSHHQKTISIDDRIAYVGGIDLTHVDGDRWDTSAHTTRLRSADRPEKYWHDVHGRLDGAVARQVSKNFMDRWRNGKLYRIHPDDLASPMRSVRLVPDNNARRDFPRVRFSSPARPHRHYTRAAVSAFTKPKVQFVRSMPASRGYSVPKGNWERTAKDAYIAGIKAAKRLIYLENQWIADEGIWSNLIDQAGERSNQRSDYHIVLMMPNEPLRAAGAGANQDIFIELNILRLLLAGHSRETLSVFSIVKPSDNDRQIYVHSKIMTVDDVWCLIGSANAGGISLEGIRNVDGLIRTLQRVKRRRWPSLRDLRELHRLMRGPGDRPDTELSFITLDPAFAHDLRMQLWREHIAPTAAPMQSDISQQIRLLRGLAEQRQSRIRFHPYLISAFRTTQFLGIDLRMFGYSIVELQQLIGNPGAAAANAFNSLYQELRKLPTLLNILPQRLQPYQPRTRDAYMRAFSNSVVGYLGVLRRVAPHEAARIDPLLQRFQQSQRPMV